MQKQKNRRRRRRVFESFWSRHRSHKLFVRTLHWNLANLVKNYHGITELQHLIDQRQNGIAERAVRRVKEGTSKVLLQSGLDEKWWADSMECYCNLRHLQDILAEGKTPYARRFGIEDLEKLDASEIHPRSINAKEVFDNTRKKMNSFSQWKMVQQNCQGDYEFRLRPDWIHEVYSFERETSQRIHKVRVEIDKNSIDHQTRSCMARSVDENG